MTNLEKRYNYPWHFKIYNKMILTYDLPQSNGLNCIQNKKMFECYPNIFQLPENNYSYYFQDNQRQ